MTSSPSPRPEPRSVDQRWRDLGVRRRWHLVTGGGWPRNRDEAITMLGYARQAGSIARQKLPSPIAKRADIWNRLPAPAGTVG